MIRGPNWEWPDDSQKMKCVALPKGYNNNVSSMKVFRTEWGAVANGDWIPITATETVNF